MSGNMQYDRPGLVVSDETFISIFIHGPSFLCGINRHSVQGTANNAISHA